MYVNRIRSLGIDMGNGLGLRALKIKDTQDFIYEHQIVWKWFLRHSQPISVPANKRDNVNDWYRTLGNGNGK